MGGSGPAHSGRVRPWDMSALLSPKQVPGAAWAQAVMGMKGQCPGAAKASPGGRPGSLGPQLRNQGCRVPVRGLGATGTGSCTPRPGAPAPSVLPPASLTHHTREPHFHWLTLSHICQGIRRQVPEPGEPRLRPFPPHPAAGRRLATTPKHSPAGGAKRWARGWGAKELHAVPRGVQARSPGPIESAPLQGDHLGAGWLAGRSRVAMGTHRLAFPLWGG